MILTLVENAFKHGQLSNGATALVIRISYDEENELFVTFIENQIALIGRKRRDLVSTISANGWL